MKNFIAVFDGYKMSTSTLAYAVHLSKISDALLTGVFLNAFFYHNYNLKSVLKQQSYSEEIIEALQENDRNQRDLAVLEFKKVCSEAGIKYAVRQDESLPLQELKYESMFADLIIINEHETFSRSAESSPYELIDALLAQTHCPVLVVPDVFSPLQQLILLYDGRPSSIFSIKMFGYLFAGLRDLPVTILTVNEELTDEFYVPENLQIRALISRLFSNVSYQVLKGKAKEQILGAVGTEAGKLVLLGAYRLNMVTGLFTDGIADQLLEIRDMPVFVPPKNFV